MERKCHALFRDCKRTKLPLGKARLHYFWLNKGPWSDIDDYKAFLPGVPARKSPGANFYPEDMSKADFESWVAALPRRSAESRPKDFSR